MFKKGNQLFVKNAIKKLRTMGLKTFKKIIIVATICLFMATCVYAGTLCYPEDSCTGTITIPIAGQLLIGATGGVYSPAYLTAGTNVTIATSSGGITISSTDTGIINLNSLTALTQTFASTSETNLGITITSSGSTHTFAPYWIGTLADGRIASASNWNTAYGWDVPTNYLATGTAVSTYVARDTWTTHDNYPAACGAGDYVSAIGDTLTCSAPTGTLFSAGNGLQLVGTTFSLDYGYPNAFTATNTFSGNVGIGTTSPAYTLDVYGNFRAATSSLGIVNAGTWQGTPVADAYISSASNWNTAYGWNVPTNYVSTTTGLTYLTSASAASTYLPISATSSFAWRANNLSDLQSTSTARINLGLAIGADVQAYDADNATTGVATLSSLISVGTITTGTWNATPIAYNYGGTGTTTALASQYLWWGNGSGGLVQVASSTLAGAAAGVSSLNTLTGALTLWGTENQLTVTASGTAGVILSTPQNIHTGASPTFAGLTLSGLVNGFLKVDASGAVSTSTIDISDNTNLTAGRSLTLTDDDMAADAELYIRSFTFAFTNATTTKNGQHQHQLPYDITITQITGYTSTSTVTIQLDKRTRTTPLTAGTDIMNASLVLDNDEQATTTFATTSVAAYQKINLDFDAVGATGIGGGVTVFYEIDD